ncbi:NfeD family protein [Acetobacterium malicum]|uniref:NfeD family protein n=1 Tax=Acetobacterium malicum TaxID=52692 RepID=A0ABR6YS57_9FIRM|nr:NfeD family protein [Acetobacterium malicum]MBC3898023.1 NfeD family protein [Acetobacterium malicum]
MNIVFVWLVLFVVFLVAELVTAGALVSIWFCIGALVALAAAYFGAAFWLQITLFFVVSIGLLLGTKPFLKKHLDPKTMATNADRILQNRGIVEEEINNLKGQGAVKIDGKSWTARNIDGEAVIPVDAEVLVVGIEGVKAMVKVVEKETISE